MSIFGKQRQLPFEEKKETEVLEKVSSFKNLRKWNLSLRGTVLLVSLIEAFLLMFKLNGSFSLSMVYIPLILLIWRGTLAHFEHPGILPLNLFLNSLLVFPLFFIPVVGITPTEFIAFVPLIIGMTVLSAVTNNGRVYFYKPDFGTEIMLPLVSAVVVSVLSYILALFMFETVLFSVMFIGAALLVALLSRVLSAFYDKPMILSFDGSFLDSLEWSNRAVVVLDIALVSGFVFAYKFFTASIELPYVIIPLIAVIVIVITMLISVRVRTVSYLVEISVAFTILLLFPSVVGIIAAMISDLLLVLIYVAYKGHKIFAKKNQAIEGLPALMILYSVLIMVFEMIIK